MTRLAAAIPAATTGLAGWWALTEPLPIPAAVQLAVALLILLCAGIVAGRGGAIAAPLALLFSLLLGSILATQLHQAFRPSFPPVVDFGGLITLRVPQVLLPIAAGAMIGWLGGLIGERLLPSRDWS